MDGGAWWAAIYGVVKSWTRGEGDGTPLQYSCLENPMDGGAWWAAIHGVSEGGIQLSDFTFTFHFHAIQRIFLTQGLNPSPTSSTLAGGFFTTMPRQQIRNQTRGLRRLEQFSSASGI